MISGLKDCAISRGRHCCRRDPNSGQVLMLKVYIARKFILDFIFHATHIVNVAAALRHVSRNRFRDKLFIYRGAFCLCPRRATTRHDARWEKRMIGIENCDKTCLSAKIASIFTSGRTEFFLSKENTWNLASTLQIITTYCVKWNTGI